MFQEKEPMTFFYYFYILTRFKNKTSKIVLLCHNDKIQTRPIYLLLLLLLNKNL